MSAAPGPDLRLGSVTGIVLAGGRSSRFGADKLASELEGRPILSRAIDAIATIASPVLVVIGPDAEPPPGLADRPDIRVVRDPEAFGGPLVGLAVALAAIETPLALIAGGDMPRLVPAVLHRLATSAAAGRAAVVLEVPGRLQPLPLALEVAVARPAAEALLASGERSLRALLAALPTATVPAPAWLSLDPSAATITDIDRPADLDRAARGDR